MLLGDLDRIGGRYLALGQVPADTQRRLVGRIKRRNEAQEP